MDRVNPHLPRGSASPLNAATEKTSGPVLVVNSASPDDLCRAGGRRRAHSAKPGIDSQGLSRAVCHIDAFGLPRPVGLAQGMGTRSSSPWCQLRTTLICGVTA